MATKSSAVRQAEVHHRQPQHASPEAFKAALGRFASGVTVITLQDGLGLYGLTATSFTSISLAPPLVSVNVRTESKMAPRLKAARTFGVNILSSKQEALSAFFAGKKDGGWPCDITIQRGAPLIGGTLASLVCRPHDVLQIGDHLVFIAEVLETRVSNHDPLLYFRGAYASLEAQQTF